MTQDVKTNNISLRASSALKDLVVIAVVFIFIVILSYFFDVFIFIVNFINKYPKAIVYVDEVIVSLLTLSICFAIFSWRRWQELKKETAERIRLQEKLLMLANTKMETERIINKQLRSEIDLRKQ